MGSRLPNHDVKGWKELQKDKEKKKIKKNKKTQGQTASNRVKEQTQ